MGSKVIKLTEEHLKLIENIKFESFVFDSDSKNSRMGWGIDQYSLFGGTYAMEDIAMILGVWDKFIPGTENDAMGRRYPDELENKMWDLYDYIWRNLEDIIRIVFYYSNKGGISEGEYKFNYDNNVWEKLDKE